MLDLHRLTLLHHFAIHGSIAGTAAALGYSPSAVSQQLAILEKEAGTALLDRTARSAELTDAGRRLAGHAATVLAAVETAEADLAAHSGTPTGRVVVSAFPTAAVALAPSLARHLRRYPAVTAVVRQQANTADGLARLRSREVDIAVIDDWTDAPVSEEPGNLTHHRLCRDPLVLAVPTSHPLADPDQPIDLAELSDEPWICAPPGEPSRRAFDMLMADAGGAPSLLWEFEGMATIASLVTRGVGIAVLPRLVFADGRRGIATRELPTAPARHVVAVTREATRHRPAIAVTLQALHAAAERYQDG